MRRNHYETMVIVNASLEDSQIEQTAEKITNFITNNGGTITDTENWGRKRLAFPIKKNRIGFYFVYRYEADVTFIKELDRLFRLDESVIRFLTITLDKNALQHFTDQKVKAEREEKEQQAMKEAEAKAESESEEQEKEPAEETEKEAESEEKVEKTEDSGETASDDEKAANEAQTDENESDTKQ